MRNPITLLVLTIAIAFAGIVYAITEIQYFTAKSEQNAILLEWKTGLEENLNRFEIERSASTPNNFIHIGSLAAIGSNSYYYYRDEMNMNPITSIYFYRLKLVDNNGGHVYSNTITVTHVISSVRDTWGSIKAIFR